MRARALLMTPEMFVGLGSCGRNGYRRHLHVISHELVESIPLAASECFKIKLDQITSLSRKKELVFIRYIIAFEIHKKFPHLTYLQIARIIGGHEHTKALYSIKMYGELIDSDKPFKNMVQQYLNYVDSKQIQEPTNK